jgi:hypothetical protein
VRKIFIYICLLCTSIVLSACSETVIETPDCFNNTQSACERLTNSGRSVFIDIQPRPVLAMREFVIRVTTDSLEPLDKKLKIEFDMPDMYMGKNIARLQLKDNNIWEGTAVLPRCPSGNTIWHAFLSIGGEHVSFTFEAK